MTDDEGTSAAQSPLTPSLGVRDHPAPLNTLGEIFDRRNIAVGIDSLGQVVLARPDSVIADVSTADRRTAVADVVETFDKDQADIIRQPDDSKAALPILKVSLGEVGRETVNGEARWTLARVREVLRTFAELDPPVPAELNTVFLGAQTVIGNPLGAPATWAGEMAFLGRVLDADDGEGGVRKVMLSTAEPAERPRFLRSALGLAGRARPRVLILDTGLETNGELRSRLPRHADLTGHCTLQHDWADPHVTSATEPLPVDDEDEFDDDENGTLDFEAGHGTFIAGIIRQLCPDADIHVAGVLSSFGDGELFHVIAGLQAGLDRAIALDDPRPIDIVVMSFGAFFADDDPGLFGSTIVELLGDTTLGIAAAGNQATCRPYFPAGLHGVIAVGAVAAAGRAWFSNFGGWVDACAPGVDVVSTFFEDSEDLGKFPDLDDVKARTYTGWSRWSGTSFSAPKVAAVLAQEMYLNLDAAGELITPREAWRRLATHHHLRMPDLGVVFNA